jgi:hypothetical protein
MKYLPVILLAASTAFSQATPQSAATLINGTSCTLDKSGPGKANCHKSKLVQSAFWPQVNLIDGKAAWNYGLQRFGVKPGEVLVQLTPGEHAVEMQQCANGNVCSQPATARFTAVPGHTYSADVLLDSSKIRHKQWIPLIYDETDNRMVSLSKSPWQ